jgi:hypothetical protein
MDPLDYPLGKALDHHFHMIIAPTTISVSRILEMTPLNYPLDHHFHMIIAPTTISVSRISDLIS